jgi:predicted DNA-binding ribbon-helix-helix protein
MDTNVMTASSGGLQKRSMRIAGHRTSLALEHEFWSALERIARSRSQTLPVLIASIDERRGRASPDASLASAVRVFVLENRV